MYDVQYPQRERQPVIVPELRIAHRVAASNAVERQCAQQRTKPACEIGEPAGGNDVRRHSRGKPLSTNNLEIQFTNSLPEPTLIHWRGLQIPAAKDGTQRRKRPLAPGETFTCRFTPPDAGTENRPGFARGKTSSTFLRAEVVR